MSNHDPFTSAEIHKLLITAKSARDDAIQDIARLEKLVGRLYLLIISTCVLLLLVTVFAFHEVDYLSCARSNTVRHFQRGNVQYALHSAQARTESANHEQQIDPKQAAIDRKAANNFINDAAQAQVSNIDCTGLFPSET